MKAKLIRLYLLSALLLGLRAFGQVEFMLNGGFESGDFTNWNLTGDDTWTIVDTGHNSGIAPRTGSYEAALGTAGSLGYLSQTVATTPGTSYLLSFWLNHSGGDPNDVFIVSWNGTTLLDETNPPAPAWTSYQFVVTATGTSTVLQFGYEAGDTDYLGLDDVSLQSQTNIAPAVTIQPVNLTVNAGQGATFSVVATGSAPIKYQWQFGGMAIAGANGSSYTIGSTVPTNAGNYSCVVSNNAGATNSVMAALTVITTPVITLQPADVTVLAGQPAAFSVTATGPQPLYYQWQFGIDGTNIVAATNATLTLNNVQPTNGGAYAVTVSNAYGAIVSSNALLTVLVLPPFITTQPTSQTVYPGGLGTFTVTADGTSPLNYQWSFNDTNLVGATNATLVLTNVQANQVGDYSVLVSNLYGSTNSVAVTLTVNPPLPSSAELLPFPLSANQRGTVTCLENPSYTYDIYLPPAYTPYGNPLPIFYTLYPSGGGMVSTFKSTCSSLNIICVGITRSANGVPWTKELREMYAVTLDIRERVLFDPTAEFAGGLSGGGECSYMFSRLRAQHVAGLFEMAGSMARGNSMATVQYYGIDRVQTNLLVARTTGTTDTAALFYSPFNSNYLATCGAVINDWSFNGGHQVPPSSLFSPIFSWLLSQRIPAGPSDYNNAFLLYTNWQARIVDGQQESVLRECVSNLMNFPRSWYAYQAQLTLDHLLTNYTAFRSLDVSNLAQGDFASDLFFYYAYGAATNGDWPRYNSCMKALTGITITNDFNGTTTITGFTCSAPYAGQIGTVYITTTNGDRAGDIYFLLTNYNHYPFPQLQCAPSPISGQLNLWLNKDTPGLAYALQTSSSLSNASWQDMPVAAVDTNTIWSTDVNQLPGSNSGFFRIRAVPSAATSPPWPPQ
ncbi:MAG: immunoglobulin domain-containing protein [Verrucomicrobiales bacterium]|nr:immunoglobulin domain-containing protein [Verrucomicrobiales bacterium]